MTDDVEAEPPKTYTVLVVDDEPDIRYLIRMTLEMAGYSVVEAPHGEAALEQVRRSTPQLVLTDRMMPRMGGGELIRRLRADESAKTIPIVMISGTNGDEPGADAFMDKPFNTAELIELVDKLVGRAR